MTFFRAVLCVLLLLSCAKEDSIDDTKEPENTFSQTTKTLGGSKNDVLQSVAKTNDGGYVTLGYTQSNNGDISTKTNESFDFWVIKYDASNSIQWSKTFGGSDDDRGADIIQTSDNGYALLGFNRSSDGNTTENSGNQDFWLIKLHTNGDILWQKSYGFSGADFGTSLLQTNDNGFLISGVLDVTASGGLGNAKTSRRHAGGDYWVLKTDSNGNLEWSSYFGGLFTDTPFGVAKTLDNSFIIAGSSDSEDTDISNNKGSYDFWVIKINEKGKLVWEKSFGGSEIDEARAIVATDDGNFIVVGDTRSADKDVTSNNGGADIWVIKIDTNGNLIWEKTIGATAFDVARSITKTQEGYFLIAGNSKSLDNGFTNKGQNDALLVKIDANGNLIWQKTFGGSKIDFLYDVTELNDKTIIAVGESTSSDGDITQDNKGFSDALLIEIKE